MGSWVLLFLLGFSFTLWTMIGGVRLAVETCTGRYGSDRTRAGRHRTDRLRGAQRPALSPADVAVLIPARNEEAGIAAAIESVMRQVPVDNIHVIADGCTDCTAEVAHGYGVNVLVLTPARGKAGGIESAVRHFDFARRFTVLLILDADTQLDEHYIGRGLRLLDDPEVGAVAGYVYSSWRPAELSPVGRLLVSYRTRLWAVMQSMKYGQTWRYTDVTPIVPGFASMYRTEVLPEMELNPAGLVIEDFNMTFELRRKRLGRVAFQPAVFATAQDPGNFRDYYRQTTRWSLGFWQTVRRHGVWCSFFSAALVAFVVESVLAAVVTVLLSVALVVAALASVAGEVLPFDDIVSPVNLLLFVLVPDYVLTVAVAVWLRRPSLLVYGMAFPFLRLVDSTATMRGLWQLWSRRSTGRWTSPVRRPVAAAAAAEARVTVEARVLAGTAHHEAPAAAMTSGVEGEAGGTPVPRRRAGPAWSEVRPVLRDTMAAVATLLLGSVLVIGGVVPPAVTPAGVVLVVLVAAIFSHRGARGVRKTGA